MTFDELCEEYAKTDSFMEPQITNETSWWLIESNYGDSTFPDDDRLDSQQMPDGKWYADKITGYGARLSASGYLDCTDWCVFDTEQEAIDYLAETYLEY